LPSKKPKPSIQVDSRLTPTNEIKYTLTPNIIKEIFATTPAVEKAYHELVTSVSGAKKKMQPTEFWTFYFASPFFDGKLKIDAKNPLNDYFEAEREKMDVEEDFGDDDDKEFGDLSIDDEYIVT
jgi:hypothetical protein